MNEAEAPLNPALVARVEQRAVVREPDIEHERELKSVIADLWQHSETLVHQELALAKAEFETHVARAKTAIVRGAISAGLYYAAYLTTLATLVLALAQWLPPWLASLIVASAASAGAFVFTRLGKESLKALRQAEEHAFDSFSEGVQQVGSARAHGGSRGV
jgi:hypothetical protein